MFRWILICLSALVLPVSACVPAAQSTGTDKIGVVVSVLPQQEFVTAVGREKVNVTVMVPPGASPHTYEVTPVQMAQLSRARMYAKVGAPIEFEITWLEKLVAQNKNMLVVDCSRGIRLIESTDPDEPGTDPHIWTSLQNVKFMVSNICSGLVQVDPASQLYYEKNRDEYLAKLDALDSEISAVLKGVGSRTFIVYHPAWGYFAHDYGLVQVGIEKEGKEPQAAYMARVIRQAREQNIRVIFVSPEFSTKNAEVIAREIGGRVVVIDPLAGDYLENMRKVVSAFKEALQ